jgi:Ner family transcriptional regulator
MKPTTQNMDWPGLKIKHALENAGYSQRDIAHKVGKSYMAVNRVIWPRNPLHSPVIEKAIADTIGVSPSEIWPSRYLNDQKRDAA